MKRFCFLLLICLYALNVTAQELIVNWTKFISCANSGSVGCGGVATDDGGFIFIGNTNCNNSGDYPFSNNGLQDVIVGKINSNEQIVWLKNFGGSSDDLSQMICKTPDGGYVVLSRTYSNNGDISGLKGASDLWLFKIDGNGNKLWSKVYGSSASETPISFAITPDNGFIILATSNGFGDDVPFHYGSSPFLSDWFVIKVDENGNKLWTKSIGGSQDEFETGTILSIDTSYYIIANSDSKDHECSDNNWNPGVPTKSDGYILKLDNTGNLLWNKVYGGTDADVFYSAFYDDRDNTIMISGGSLSNDHYLSGNNGGMDFWILKIDLDGNIIWNELIGAAQDEQWSTIIKGPQNGYMLYGYTSSGKYSAVDSWLFALNNAGKIIKDKFIGGNKNESSNFIFSYQTGYIAVGYTFSEFFEEGRNNQRLGPWGQLHLTKVEYFPLTIDDDFKVESIIIYPNPNNGAVQIGLPRKNRGKLSIINVTGQTVKIVAITKRTDSIIHVDTSNWASGVYAVIFETENGHYYKTTLIKE